MRSQQRSPLIRPAVLLLSTLLVWLPVSPLSAQGNCSGGVSAAPPVENRDGHFVNLEEAPIHPLELGSTGQELWSANLPDGRIVVWSLAAPLSPVKVAEVGVGLGPVSIRLRPAAGSSPRELWVACQSSNAVFVIDETSRRVTKVVRLVGEPTDIAFDPGNQFAYVSLAATNRIAKVDANTLAVAPALIFDADFPVGSTTRVEAEEPRALLVDGNDLYALSQLSGNGTLPVDAANLFDPAIANAWHFNLVPPDRDVIRFDLTSAAPVGSAALWRMGTLNFDLVKASDGRIYVSTVDFDNQTVAPAGNQTHEGEFDYKAKGFGRHLITHAVAGTGAPQTGTQAINLNVDVDALLPTSFRCSVPTDIAYEPVANRLFVACYETRNVAVVQLNATAAGGTVIAELLANPLAAPSAESFGPRGVQLSANGQTAFVHFRGDHRLRAYDLTGLGPGSRIAPSGAAQKIGFDITPPSILNGRRHFLNAANSGNGTSTCNTCHLDGHLDGVAWDLSDFTGKLDSTPVVDKVGREPKGTKVTMSLRGIEETPPFHWRGDRADLDAFNPAFEGLLGGTQLSPDEMREFEDFVFSLSYPANPHLADGRTYSQPAKDGFDCFSTHQTMHTVLHDATGGSTGNPNGNLAISCQGCHAMDGSSGTLNQVNNPFPIDSDPIGDDATQLRGLWDKESQPATVVLNPTSSIVIPATGWGFANTGVVDSILDFINIGVFDHQGHDGQIETLLREFDTGIAPTAAFAVMLSGAVSPTAEERLLTSSLAAAQPSMANPTVFPAHDLIARGTVQLVAGGPQVPMGLLWTGGKFLTDRAGVAFTLTALKAKVAAGNASLALIGVPVGSGWRLGIDRDLDFRLDGDEVSVPPLSSPDNPDSDGDTLPDGYEIANGFDPSVFNGTPPAETTAPKVLTAKIAWRNSNVLRARWATDEESTTRIRAWQVVGGLLRLVWDREDTQFKRYHSAIARKLEPGNTYRIEVATRDPKGNQRFVVLSTGQATQPHLFQSTHTTETSLDRTGGGPPAVQQYTAKVTVADETGAPIADGAMVSGRLVEWDNAACTFNPPATPPCSTVTDIPAVPTVGGTAVFSFGGSRIFSNGKAEFFVTGVVDNLPPIGAARLYFKPLDGQFGFWAQVDVP